MDLFNNKKNIYQKIVNIILLIWFIGALVVCYSTIVELLFPSEPVITYNEYKATRCITYAEKSASDTSQIYNPDCKTQYDVYKTDLKRNNYYKRNALLMAFGNVVIVGTALWLLNKKKED
jgi:hypothetical protein